MVCLGARSGRHAVIAQIRALASNLASRASLASLAGLTFGGSRDLYEALGYQRNLFPKDYRDRYKRNGIAARIVEAFPKATWRGGAELIEDEDPETSTPFEEAWGELDDRLNVWSVLGRTDILAGLGAFSVVLIGAEGDLEQELPKLKSPECVLFLSSYGEDEVSVDALVEDSEDPRFGLPLTYGIKRSGAKKHFSRRVHWTRVLHIADGVLDDRINGTPRLERVWNWLDDLEKITGSGSEAFWLRVNRPMIFNLEKGMKIEQPQIDKLEEEAEELSHQLRRTMATRGFSVETLGGDVSNFNNQVMSLITLIAGSTGIPQRILLGSERGELASTQDKQNWDERVSDRRHDYAEPIVRTFADRLIEHGCLPEPEQYNVRWPEIEDLDDTQKANVADKWSKLNSQAGGIVVQPEEIRDRVLGLPKLEEAGGDDDLDLDDQAIQQIEVAEGEVQSQGKAQPGGQPGDCGCKD